MNGMHKTQFDQAFRPYTPRSLITCVLPFLQVKLTQSTAMEQKRLDLRSLSRALTNLWLLLVYCLIAGDKKSPQSLSPGVYYRAR